MLGQAVLLPGEALCALRGIGQAVGSPMSSPKPEEVDSSGSSLAFWILLPFLP